MTKGAWRVYKQSALVVIEQWPDPDVGLVDRAEAYQWLSEQNATGARGPKDQVADGALERVKRTKSIPIADLEAILAEVSRRGGAGRKLPSDDKMAWIVGDWLIAAVATGLRPVEWRQARLVFRGAQAWPSLAEDLGLTASITKRDSFATIPPDWTPPDGRVHLIVHSTKHSNNRGNQAVRTLEITDFPLEIIRSIARMVWRGAERSRPWEKIQVCGTMLLRRVQAHLWPRRKTTISFYSARHQAMANWKESIGTFAAAVLAGHGKPDGPERYYAARANSWHRRRDDKGSTGGVGPSSKSALLVQTAAPGRAQGEIDSLVEKAGEIGMARLAKPNPHVRKAPASDAAPIAPAPGGDDLSPFDF